MDRWNAGVYVWASDVTQQQYTIIPNPLLAALPTSIGQVQTSQTNPNLNYGGFLAGGRS